MDEVDDDVVMDVIDSRGDVSILSFSDADETVVEVAMKRDFYTLPEYRVTDSGEKEIEHYPSIGTIRDWEAEEVSIVVAIIGRLTLNGGSND